jgi:S-sulfo-L-cysteine synthase (O-acetyl-L-serine-dependent)
MHASDPAAVVEPAPSARSVAPSASPASDPLVAAIGRTPLLPLGRLVAAEGGGFTLAAKAEFLNPTGSVKDRAAAAMVRAGLESGQLRSGRTLLDASSGNTALAYAMLGARLGFPVELVLPRNAHPERVERIRAFGAAVRFTDPGEGTDGAQQEARRLADAEPDRYFFPDQYNNPANPGAHERTTGPEIWEQTDGRLTHFVAGVGTGGTISGVGHFLHRVAPSVRIVGVEPTGPIHGLEGLKHLPTALRPSTYDAAVVDETIRIETEEAERVRERLGREEGLHVGASAGAAVAAALRIGRAAPGAYVVTILPDGGHGRPGEP